MSKEISIKLSSHCIKTLKAYIMYLQKIMIKLNIRNSVFFLPKREKTITLLRSPHVFKKSKEQFKLERNRCIIKLEVIDKNKIYLLFLNKPKSINIKTKISF